MTSLKIRAASLLSCMLCAFAGTILDELEADGLADDTIVVFWSDHGEGIPHGKRSLTEHGLRVPLIVHVPKTWRGRVPLPGGAADGGTTSALAGSEWAIFHPGQSHEGDARSRYDAILDTAWAVADGRNAAFFADRLTSADPAVRCWAMAGTDWAARRTAGTAAPRPDLDRAALTVLGGSDAAPARPQ